MQAQDAALVFTFVVLYNGYARGIRYISNEKCQSVQELEVTRFLQGRTRILRLFPRALRNLTSYKGSSDFLIPLMDAGSSLKRLDISNCPMLLVDALGLLEKVAARWPNLESLDITIKEWDTEILYAISHLFRDFRVVEDQV